MKEETAKILLELVEHEQLIDPTLNHYYLILGIRGIALSILELTEQVERLTNQFIKYQKATGEGEEPVRTSVSETVTSFYHGDTDKLSGY